MQSGVAGSSVLETLWSARLFFSSFPEGMLVGHWRKGVLLLLMLSLVYKLNFSTFLVWHLFRALAWFSSA